LQGLLEQYQEIELRSVADAKTGETN